MNALPSDSGLLRLPHVLLLAVDGRRIIARMMTGVDEAGNGYFSLFDALPDKQAVFSMLDEAVSWQKKRGGKCLLGPVSPELLDLEAGIMTEGFGQEASFGERHNPPYYGEYLEEYGFSVESVRHSFRLKTACVDAEKYRKAAEWTGMRMGLKTTDLSEQPRELARVMHEVMESDAPGQEAVNRAVGRLQAFMTYGMCPAAYDQRTGEAAGFLVSIGNGKEKPVRIANLWIKEAWRRKGAAVMLFEALLNEALRRNMAEIDASFVVKDNLASEMTARAAGGAVIHSYCRYGLEI